MTPSVPIDIKKLADHPLFKRRDDDFNCDNYLYHYTRWETLPEIVYSNSLRMCSIERMNDPRESKDWVIGTSHQGPPDLTGIDMPAVIREVARYRQDLKLVALSQDVQLETVSHPYLGAGFARPTMWAHYAGNHTGCCIVFDKPKLIRRFMEESTDKFGSPSGVMHAPMAYTADAFGGDLSLRGINAEAIRRLGVEDAVRQHFSAINQVWFQKHSDWQSEAEYRFVYHDYTKRDVILIDISDCVVGLVLGADFRESHLVIARDFNDSFGLGGCVAQCMWIGPYWGMQDLCEVGGQWRYAPSRRGVAHSGISIAVSKTTAKLDMEVIRANQDHDDQTG
jgi:hypothetical protein